MKIKGDMVILYENERCADFKTTVETALKEGVPLAGADFRKQDLRGVDFSGQDLQFADFSGADLRNADFRGANLHSVDFFDCNLGEANLEGADFNSANLEGVNLQGALLTNADFRGVRVGWTAAEDAIESNSDFYKSLHKAGAIMTDADKQRTLVDREISGGKPNREAYVERIKEETAKGQKEIAGTETPGRERKAGLEAPTARELQKEPPSPTRQRSRDGMGF